jgi:hypothetical protein
MMVSGRILNLHHLKYEQLDAYPKFHLQSKCNKHSTRAFASMCNSFSFDLSNLVVLAYDSESNLDTSDSTIAFVSEETASQSEDDICVRPALSEKPY